MSIGNAFKADLAADGAKIATYVVIGGVAVLVLIMLAEYVHAELQGESDQFTAWLNSLNPF
jgi:hypothetical protein